MADIRGQGGASYVRPVPSATGRVRAPRSLALHDLSVDAKEELLAGYGMTPRELLDDAPALRAFNVLNYAAVVSRAVKEDDQPTLDRLRARLHGALDLYAF